MRIFKNCILSLVSITMLTLYLINDHFFWGSVFNLLTPIYLIIGAAILVLNTNS